VVDAVRVTRLLRSLDEGLASLARREKATPAQRRIGGSGIIETKPAAAMVAEVGFRNVLVHEYVDVDDQIVKERLEHHEDLRNFAVQVGEWLSRQ